MATPISTLLPPWPDDMLERPDKAAAIEWVRALRLPAYVAARHLRRWAIYTGTRLDAGDYERAGAGSHPGSEF